MSYTKHNFQTGAVLTAAQLNEMDDGIAEAVGGATPVTGWSEDHYYLATSGDAVDVSSPAYVGNAHVRYLAAVCSPGEVFTVTVTGGNSYRAWAFADASGNILARSGVNVTVSALQLTAPANAAYLIVNDKSLQGSVLRGMPARLITAVVDQATDGSPVGVKFSTIEAAVASGAERVVLAADYYGSFTIDKPCVFDGAGYTVYGDVLLTTEEYSSILRAPYAADATINACFVDKTTPLTETVSGSSWKGDKYNICCYADDKKLLPVASVALCEETENSFTWSDGYFYIHATGTRFGYVTQKLCSVNADCTIIGLNMRHFQSSILQITAGSVEIIGGAFIGSVNDSCITGTRCDMILRNVETALCWNDGINIHTTGNCVLFDCYCHDCSDDGVSHHDSTTGAVYGGEFCRCGKGGIASPVNASVVDIYHAYCHDNDYGVYATASGSDPQTYNVFGCVLTSNRIGIMNAYSTVRLYGNKIAGNTTNISNQSGGTVVDLDALT